VAFARKPETAPTAFGGISQLQSPLLVPNSTVDIISTEAAKSVALPEMKSDVVAKPVLTVEQVLAKANVMEKIMAEKSQTPAMSGSFDTDASGPEDPQDKFICDSCQ
jgi:hypothetical protein